MYTSQEMPNLRRFLARFLTSDNQMTIIVGFFVTKGQICSFVDWHYLLVA